MRCGDRFKHVVVGLPVVLLLLSLACSDDGTPPDAGGDGPALDQATDVAKGEQPAPDLTKSCAGQPDEVELKYDDGTADRSTSPWSDNVGGEVGVLFTPPCYPVTITSADFYVTIDGTPTTEFRVRVYTKEQLDGKPGSELLSAVVTATAKTGNAWVSVDLSSHKIKVDKGDVLVAMHWLTPPGNNGANAQFLGADTNAPTDKRSWWKTGTLWEPIKLFGSFGDRDLMIRVKVKTR